MPIAGDFFGTRNKHPSVGLANDHIMRREGMAIQYKHGAALMLLTNGINHSLSRSQEIHILNIEMMTHCGKVA
jgi:hypothetical protein